MNSFLTLMKFIDLPLSHTHFRERENLMKEKYFYWLMVDLFLFFLEILFRIVSMLWEMRLLKMK